MIDATVSEFPFVESLPKREQRQVETVWDSLQSLKWLCQDKGLPVPPNVAADLLGVSRQRVHQMMKAGQLERVEFRGHPFILESSIRFLAETERKAGRPPLPKPAKNKRK